MSELEEPWWEDREEEPPEELTIPPSPQRLRRGLVWVMVISLVLGSVGAWGIPFWLDNSGSEPIRYSFPGAETSPILYVCRVTLEEGSQSRVRQGEGYPSVMASLPCLDRDGKPVSNWTAKEILSVINLSPVDLLPTRFELELGQPGGFSWRDLLRAPYRSPELPTYET